MVGRVDFRVRIAVADQGVRVELLGGAAGDGVVDEDPRNGHVSLRRAIRRHELPLVRETLEGRDLEALEALRRVEIVDQRVLLERPPRQVRGIRVVSDGRPRIIRGAQDAIGPRIGVGDRNVVRAIRAEVVRDAIRLGPRVHPARANGEIRDQFALD